MDDAAGLDVTDAAETPSVPDRPPRWTTARTVVAAVMAVIVLAGAAAFFLTDRTDPAAQDAVFIAKVTAAMKQAPAGPAKLAAQARAQCDADAATMTYLAGLIKQDPSSNVAQLVRIGISVYCPERTAEFEQDLTS